MDAHNDVTIAGFLAVAIGLVEVVKTLVSWLIDRMKGADAKKDGPTPASVVVVQLDPEVSRMIKETHDNVQIIDGVINLKDQEGVPMIYTSRTIPENVADVAASLKDVSKTQERTVLVVERLVEKVDNNSHKLDDIYRAVKK